MPKTILYVTTSLRAFPSVKSYANKAGNAIIGKRNLIGAYTEIGEYHTEVTSEKAYFNPRRSRVGQNNASTKIAIVGVSNGSQ